jgi:hypothetical protein
MTFKLKLRYHPTPLKSRPLAEGTVALTFPRHRQPSLKAQTSYKAFCP